MNNFGIRDRIWKALAAEAAGLRFLFEFTVGVLASGVATQAREDMHDIDSPIGNFEEEAKRWQRKGKRKKSARHDQRCVSRSVPHGHSSD